MNMYLGRSITYFGSYESDSRLTNIKTTTVLFPFPSIIYRNLIVFVKMFALGYSLRSTMCSPASRYGNVSSGSACGKDKIPTPYG
jgi:hypothetical protein